MAPPPQPPLTGHLEGRVYVSPTGTFRIAVPVLPELGGTVIDTSNVVTFQDSFNVHVSIGAFPQDATQRWEFSTRGTPDYLVFFFTNYVMSDFQQMFPGASIESAQYSPDLLNGSRRLRVAKGSGRPISEVNRLLEQFRDMQKMMKKMSGGGRMPPGMFGGIP